MLAKSVVRGQKCHIRRSTFIVCQSVTRYPTPAQLQHINTAMSQGMKIEEVAWAILNGREFIFIQ
jgi:hypothetical protein